MAWRCIDCGGTGRVKTPNIQNRPKNYPLARQISAIPAFFLSFRFFSSFRRKPESRANTARNAHIRAMAAAGGGASLSLSAAPSLRPEGARSARFIRWIPACAGMARWGHENGGVGFIRWMSIGFLHRLESGNPAQIQRGTRTFARWRRQAVTQSRTRKADHMHHSPLEGESARRGRKPDVAPVGGTSKAPTSPHRPGEPQGPHTPHRSSRRLAAWLLRLPLKGGVMGRMRRRACPWLVFTALTEAGIYPPWRGGNRFPSIA